MRYARFHLGDGAQDGTRLLAEDSLRSMQSEQAQADEDNHMGLPWMLSDVGGLRFVAHGGSTNGQTSAFWMVPERDFAFTLLTNADHGDRVCREVSRWVQREYLGVEEEDPDPVETPESKLEEYAGRYVLGGVGGIIRMRVEGEALIFEETHGDLSAISETNPEPPPAARAKLHDKDRMILLDGPYKGARGEFLRGQDGSIAWLRLGRVFARQRAQF